MEASQPMDLISYLKPWSSAMAARISTSMPTSFPLSSVYSNGLNAVSVTICHTLSLSAAAAAVVSAAAAVVSAAAAVVSAAAAVVAAAVVAAVSEPPHALRPRTAIVTAITSALFFIIFSSHLSAVKPRFTRSILTASAGRNMFVQCSQPPHRRPARWLRLRHLCGGSSALASPAAGLMLRKAFGTHRRRPVRAFAISNPSCKRIPDATARRR